MPDTSGVTNPPPTATAPTSPASNAGNAGAGAGALASAGVSGALAVGLGAFGAHGLARLFDAAPDGARRLALWQTAAQYHLVHALALGLAGVALSSLPARSARAARVAAACFGAGTLLFSGSLYALALTGLRALGAVTPFGGALFIAGWLAMAWSAFRARARVDPA